MTQALPLSDKPDDPGWKVPYTEYHRNVGIFTILFIMSFDIEQIDFDDNDLDEQEIDRDGSTGQKCEIENI